MYAKQELDRYLGTLFFSDPDFFPIQRPSTLPATQSTPNSPTNLVNTLYPNIRINSDTPPLNLHQSPAAQIHVSSVHSFPGPPTPLFVFYPSSELLTAQISISTPSQIAQTLISTFKPEVFLKPTEIKPSIVHGNSPRFLLIDFDPQFRNSLATLLSQLSFLPLYQTLPNLFL